MSERMTICKHFIRRFTCEACDLASQLEEANERIRELQTENFNLRTWAQTQIKEEDALKRLREIIKI